jgi:hypothetical protein
MSSLTENIEATLLEAVSIKRWDGDKLNNVLTENEAINLIDNIAIRLDNAGYEIKKK